MGTPYEVSSVLTEKKGQLPVLVEFENGKINPDLPQPLKCKIFRDNHHEQKKYITVENENTTYIGSPDCTNNPFHTYLAIRNRETRKVQLVKIESVRATAAVGRELYHDLSKANALNENALLDLSRKFGSKNAKRLQEQRLKFKLVAKSDGHLREVVKDKVINTEELKTTPDDNLPSLLPPCNTTASSPNEVYDMDHILTVDEMESLKEGFQSKSTDEEETFIKTCSLLFNALVNSCMKNPQRMSLLLYAEYLIRMCNKLRFRSFRELCDCSDVIAKKMSREFTSKKGSERILSNAESDKAILRIIIISLYLSDFKLQILPLANSLRRINTSRIKLLVRVTGANFSSKSSEVATLKVPITPFNMNSHVFSKKKR